MGKDALSRRGFIKLGGGARAHLFSGPAWPLAGKDQPAVATPPLHRAAR